MSRLPLATSELPVTGALPTLAPTDPGWARDWREARRVLAVRLDGMGDLLMTSPALAALTGAGRERHVTLLTSPDGAEAASLLPAVDDVLVYRSPWMKATAGTASAEQDHEMIERIEAGSFDAAVIFTVYSQSPLPAALLLHLAKVPLRLAYCRENPYGLLTHHVPETEPEGGVRHEAARHLDLLTRVGYVPTDPRMRVEPNPSARRRVSSLLARLGLADSDDWFVAHVGASAPSRRYPPERFAAAIAELSVRHGLTPLLTGSGSERELVAGVRSLAGGVGVDLAGALDLHELAALIARAPVLLSNNTGPAHLAAATGTPVVDLYALTNPQHTPWLVPSRVLFHDVPCRNCYRSACPLGHHACLAGIEPSEIVRSVLSLLAESAPRTDEEVVHAALA